MVSACFHGMALGGTGGCETYKSEGEEDSRVEHGDDLFPCGRCYEKRCGR
jgi:hypothetical protein